jgi:N-6 DNA Methylase
MSRPSPNDIRHAAARFAHDWHEEASERGESQAFWTDFLQVFGVQRRRVNAAFERHARRSSTGRGGFIDLLWPTMLLAEHKSRGADLEQAMAQALDYVDGLQEADFPRYVVVSDFARMKVLDLDDASRNAFEFALEDLPQHIDRFLSLAGYTSRRFESEAAVNVKAAELLGRVYDEIAATGYAGHPLRGFIVRLLFLLFGDDTGLWPRKQFSDLLVNRTSEDGSDLGMWLGRLFDVLDTDDGRRTTALDEDLAAFPFVNGGLFREHLDPPDTTRSMRARLLEASRFDWSQISPAVFGSMFQSVMDPEARRSLGAHYTSESNIMKVIRPLFLDELEADLEACGRSKSRLREFHNRLGALTFFDPACGCGNFLVIAYRELRRLEHKTLARLHAGDVQMTTELDSWRKVTLDQFFGIEIEEFPVRIAETAMHIIDHLENEALSRSFGQNVVDLPLEGTATIHHADALELDWADVLPPQKCSYILGNPPYAGKHLLNERQRANLSRVLERHELAGSLDYVAGWFSLAADYLAQNPAAQGAFVSTNSITQGEQVPALWPRLHDQGLHIRFAWRPFNWTSQARGQAQVHVVIIGFVHSPEPPAATLYEPSDDDEGSISSAVSGLNGYLVASGELYPVSRSRPLSDVAAVVYGSKPADGGHLLLTPDEASEIRQRDSIAAKYIRPLLSATEFVNGKQRFCLWLQAVSPMDVGGSEELRRRLAAVRRFREGSSKSQTRLAAETPGLFAEIRVPTDDFIFVPIHVSSARRLVPMGFVTADQGAVVHNSGAFIEGADLALFGLLQSEMFAAWQRTIGGRIKSDFRFNNRLVYNTFPFPRLSDRQHDDIAAEAHSVLDARAAHPQTSLADLYRRDGTPSDLVLAHRRLDRVVDSAFGRRSTPTETERLSVLFARFEEGLRNEVRPSGAEGSVSRVSAA